MQDKFRGCVVGAAIGDALGYPVEFSSVEQIQKEYGEGGVLRPNLTYLSSEHSDVSLFSDDTQMSIAVMRGLTASGKSASAETVAEAVAKEFVAWARDPPDGHRAPGGACMAGCAALSHGAPWATAGGITAGGCGSVMRSHPYALWEWPNTARAVHRAVSHSGMTHRDPLALASCAALVTGLHGILRGQSLVQVGLSMANAADRFSRKAAETIARAASDVGNPDRTDAMVFSELRGWAAHEAVAAGLYCYLRHPENYVECVRLGANTPGDSDSIASIAGALSGAAVGLQGIPPAWAEFIEKRQQLMDLADEIYRQATGGADTGEG